MSDRDRRRYGVIEVRRISVDCYRLTIDGQMWSEVEWSDKRQCWCVQDAAGHCLTHVEHIVGQDRDAAEAIKLAKRMIVDARMPSPEQARESLEQGQAPMEKIGARKATRADMRELLEALKLPAYRKTSKPYVMTDMDDDDGICTVCGRPYDG
jgi:hypothetical protein